MFNPCSICWASCCKTYTITTTSFDILGLCQHTGKRPEEFAVLHEACLLSYDPDLVLELKDSPRGRLLGLKSHPCFFLGSNNRCKAYNNAPLSCRMYPFTVAGGMNARFCPLLPKAMFSLKGPAVPKELVLKELEDYKEIVKEWNRKPGTAQECIPFLLKRSKESF